MIVGEQFDVNIFKKSLFYSMPTIPTINNFEPEKIKNGASK